MGRHARRKSDQGPYQPPAFGDAGRPEQVRGFDENVSQHIVNVADKRLRGQFPYDSEPGSKRPIDPETGIRRNQG